MPYWERTLRAAPALPVAFVVAAAPVVVAGVKVAGETLVEETFAVTAPRPSPLPLATGTVVTVEKELDEVAELLWAEVVLDEEPDEDLADEDAVEDEMDEELDEEPEELPSVLMLCQLPDISE